jgi:hypothetical protein
MSKFKFMPLLLGALSLTAAHAVSAATAGRDRTLSVRIENISTDRTLKLPDGSTKRVPVAPGAYAVVTQGRPIFQKGKPALRNGLEALSEDGDAAALITSLQKRKDVREAGVIVPGQSLAFTPRPGDRIIFASIFVASNDLFYGTGPEGIALFDASRRPIMGDVTAQISLWDAGTERNEVPGAGPNQGPRQKSPNTGVTENAAVKRVNDGFTYPEVSEVLRVTIGID